MPALAIEKPTGHHSAVAVFEDSARVSQGDRINFKTTQRTDNTSGCGVATLLTEFFNSMFYTIATDNHNCGHPFRLQVMSHFKKQLEKESGGQCTSVLEDLKDYIHSDRIQ